MARAVTRALTEGSVLLVQAGTGTGKSLGYLVPAVVHAINEGSKVVVATATLALQNQLATKDGPAVVEAVPTTTGRRPTIAVLKGRANYACLVKAQQGVTQDQDTLLSGADLAEAVHSVETDAETALGAEVLALREWVADQARGHELADRDDAPAHTARAWAQVSISARQCPGSRCALYDECFVEQARARARGADVIVTNHALLAIDAMSERDILPDHDAVIIDEAHELTARVTGAASQELSPQQIERLSRAAADWIDDDLAVELLDVADALLGAIDDAEPGRVTNPHSACVAAIGRVRDVARRVLSSLGSNSSKGSVEPDRAAAQGDAREVFETAQRMADLRDADVVWISERERFGRQLNVAPLSVAGLLRHRVLAGHGAVLTSATLTVGGSFGPMAGQLGLRKAEELSDDSAAHEGGGLGMPQGDEPGAGEEAENAAGPAGVRKGDAHQVDSAAGGGHSRSGDEAVVWRGIDVGTPFDYRRQGIIYTAAALPRPGREGLSAQALAQIAQLVWAAGGRTLGLFSSQRNAEAAARHLRAELPSLPVLCQGEAQLPELTRRFAIEPSTSLFGTLSLWQGIDLPGDTCQLVLIDRIPFPRPDDPVMAARQEAVTKSGGNGFMRVAATHAGLLLAQGAGRLIRTAQDRGVVAILDSRLVTARYGGFLRASLPDFWQTRDIDVAVNALRRLAGKN